MLDKIERKVYPWTDCNGVEENKRRKVCRLSFNLMTFLLPQSAALHNSMQQKGSLKNENPFFFSWKVQIHVFSNISTANWSHRYAINIFSQASYRRNWSNGGRRVRNVWWLIFYCLPAQILKVIVGLWRRQSLIPSEQIVPVWGKNGGYVKNYQLSWERLINFGKHPFKQSCKNKRTSIKQRLSQSMNWTSLHHFTHINAGVI